MQLKAKNSESSSFNYHHTDNNHYLAQLDKTVVGIVNCITKEEYENKSLEK